jgi:hypothetical protein
MRMRVDAAERRTKRVRALLESASRVDELGLEATRQAIANEQRAKDERRLREFLARLSEKLCEFVSFESSPTEDVILESCDRLVAMLRKALERTPERETPPNANANTNASADARREWEEWASRMCARATNDFSMAKAPDEMRHALEEALGGGSEHARLLRKLEVLRFEKKMLKDGVQQSAGERRPTMFTVMSVVNATRKLQKLSSCS